MKKLPITQRLAWAWFVSIIAGSYVSIQFMMQSSIGLMIPSLQRSFQVDLLSISFLSALYFYAYLLMQIPSGLLTDRYGARRVLLVSIVLFVLSIWVFASTSRYEVAQLSRFLMGMVVAPGLTCGMWIAARWFSHHWFPVAAGVIETMGMVGGALSYLLLPLIIHSSYGWRGSLSMIAGSGLVLLLLIYLFVFDHKTDGSNGVQLAQRSITDVMAGLKRMLTYQQAWFCGVYAGMMFSVISGFASLWSVPFWEQRFPGSADGASQSAAALFIGVAIGTPFCGWFSEWVGSRRWVMCFYAILSFVILLIILYWPDLSEHIALAWMFFLGFYCSAYVLPFVHMRELVSPEYHGVAMGYTNMMCILFGAPILQPLVGIVLHGVGHPNVIDGIQQYTLGDYQLALLCFPICFLLALLMVYFIKE